MQDGVCVARHEGTPQGGPLSPLLANLLLDDLDKELERRGHTLLPLRRRLQHLCAVAGGGGAGAGVGDASSWKGSCDLRVNREKSAVAHVAERKFLGHRLLRGRHAGDRPKSLERAKERIRQITRRNRGISLERMIARTQLVPDRLGDVLPPCGVPERILRELDGWIRRKLRCVRLKQCKRAKTIADFLQETASRNGATWRLASRDKG